MIMDRGSLHDTLVEEGAKAIGAAHRAVVAAAYGDYNGFAAAANEHFCRAARVEELEARIDAAQSYDGFRGFDGNFFKKVVGGVGKAVSKATSAVKTAGKVLSAGATTVFQPIERALPKGVVNVAKAAIQPALTPFQITAGLLTDPRATIKSAPGKIFARPITSAMAATAEIGKIAGSKTVIGRAARSTEQASKQLQTYANKHPVQTLAAAAAVAAVVVAAPVVGPAIGSAASSAASAMGISTGTLATATGGSVAAAGKDFLVKEATGYVKAKGKSLLKGAVEGAADAIFTPQTQAALAAKGIVPGGAPPAAAGGGAGALIAGGVAGFFVGGPIGAAIGLAAGAMLGKQSSAPTTMSQPV